MMRFHHIGLVCKDLATGEARLEEIFGPLKWSTAYKDEIQRVWVQFGVGDSGVRYEIVAPLNDRAPVNEALRQGKNILNHVAYTVRSIAEQSELLRRHGCMPLGVAQPAAAFGGANIQFFITSLRFILELIEEKEPTSQFRE